MFFCEFKRAMSSKNIKITILIGIAILLIGMFFEIKDFLFFNFDAPDLQGEDFQNKARKLVETGLNKYSIWILSINYYIVAIPILAGIPFSLSYSDDLKNNMIDCIRMRVSYKRYIINKIIVNFIAGFIAIATPISIITILIFSIFKGEIGGSIANKNFGGFLSTEFNYNTVVFMIVFIIIQGIIGGVYSNIAICVSAKIKNSMVILLTPIIVWAGGSTLIKVVGLNIETPMSISQFYWNNIEINSVIIQLFILFIVPTVIYFKFAKKELLGE